MEKHLGEVISFADVWMLMSMTFVFCSLLELAIVGYKVKNEEMLKKRGSSYSKKVPVLTFNTPASIQKSLI